MFAAQFITKGLLRQRARMALAASERCEHDRLQQIQLRLLCFGHHFGGLPTEGLRLGSCAAGAFQVDENFFGAIKDFLWQSGKARDLNAVAFIGAARDDFAQENNLLIPFANGDV
jgi:hypothetical protein